jgi:hypothetical protein
MTGRFVDRDAGDQKGVAFTGKDASELHANETGV